MKRKENLIELQTLYLMWIIHEYTYTYTHTHAYTHLTIVNVRTSFTFYTQSSCLLKLVVLFLYFEPFCHHFLFLPPHPSLVKKKRAKGPKN